MPMERVTGMTAGGHHQLLTHHFVGGVRAILEYHANGGLGFDSGE